MVLGHPFDQNELGTVFGAILIFEIDDELVEFYCAFPGEEDEHAASIGETVDEVVLRGCGLTRDRRRTAGEFCVGLVGLNLSLGCHRWKCPFTREFRARAFGRRQKIAASRWQTGK